MRHSRGQFFGRTPGTPILRIAGRQTGVRPASHALNWRGLAGLAASCTAMVLAVGFTAPAWHKVGLGGDDNPVELTGPPAPGSQIVYSDAGRSDALGVGSTVVCLLYSDCPDGMECVSL